MQKVMELRGASQCLVPVARVRGRQHDLAAGHGQVERCAAPLAQGALEAWRACNINPTNGVVGHFPRHEITLGSEDSIAVVEQQTRHPAPRHRGDHARDTREHHHPCRCAQGSCCRRRQHEASRSRLERHVEAPFPVSRNPHGVIVSSHIFHDEGAHEPGRAPPSFRTPEIRRS